MRAKVPLPTKKSSARRRAAASGEKTYKGRVCSICGNNIRNVSDQRCASCVKAKRTYYSLNKDKAQSYYRRKYYGDLEGRAKHMWRTAKFRAERNGLGFNISPEDVVIPDVCPVFGTPMTYDNIDRKNSPSLDRVDNDKGYVKGNVRVISNRANTLKRDLKIDEVRAILAYMEDHFTQNAQEKGPKVPELTP